MLLSSDENDVSSTTFERIFSASPLDCFSHRGGEAAIVADQAGLSPDITEIFDKTGVVNA